MQTFIDSPCFQSSTSACNLCSQPSIPTAHPLQPPARAERGSFLHMEGGGWSREGGMRVLLLLKLTFSPSFCFHLHLHLHRWRNLVTSWGFCSAVSSTASQDFILLSSAESVVKCPSTFPLQNNVFGVISFCVFFVLKDSVF